MLSCGRVAKVQIGRDGKAPSQGAGTGIPRPQYQEVRRSEQETEPGKSEEFSMIEQLAV